MVRYFYSWGPLGIVFGTLILVAIPPLALIALALVTVAALAALTGAIVSALHALSLANSSRRQARPAASPRTATALSPATHPHA